MPTITGSINLMKFVGARKVVASGEKGIFIPIDQNPSITPGAKGAYASIRIVEKESTFNDRHYSHFCALSLPKEKKEQLRSEGYSDEQLNGLTPILGNLETFKPRDEYQTENIQEVDDLPFI